MKKTLIAAAACVGLLTAGVATSAAESSKTDPEKVAAKLCVEQKNADKAAFEATWGDNAMRDCKRAARSQAAEAVQNSSEQCRAEQEADPVAFEATYGTNGAGKGNGKGDGNNAFGKCVSGKTDEAVAEEVTAFKNAAQECRAERDADPAAFQATHGTNENKKNAFGKCVSSKVTEDDDAAVA